MPSINTVTTLSGVQWTDLDGANLTPQQSATQAAYITGLTNQTDVLENLLIDQHPNDVVSLTELANDMFTDAAAATPAVYGQQTNWSFNANGVRTYAGTTNWEDVQQQLIAAWQAHTPPLTGNQKLAVSFSHNGGATWSWGVLHANGTIHINDRKWELNGYWHPANPDETDRVYQNLTAEQMFALGDIVAIKTASISGQPTPAKFATKELAIAHLATVGNNTAVSYYDAATRKIGWVGKNGSGNQVTNIAPGSNQVQLRALGYTTFVVGTQGVVPTMPLTLAQINSQLGYNLTANTRLSVSAWRQIVQKLEGASYLEASKLSTSNGGGIKTYNGKWYANGQEVNYLDIIFAVRVNQLFVINNTITDQLNQVQKTNKQIKFANSLSSIFSSRSPTNSSGTVGVDELTTSITLAALSSGFSSLAAPGYEETASFNINTKINTLSNNSALYYKAYGPGHDFHGKAYWAVKDAGGTVTFKEATPANTLYVLNKADASGNHIKAVGVKLTGMDFLTSMMPEAMKKIYNPDTGGFKEDVDLNQTHCTTITTELKSYISNQESNNQTAQTQLDQYNNKRSEVLEDISNIVKGSTNALNSIGKNFGALA